MPDFRIRSAGLADLDQLCPLFDAYRQFYGNPGNLPAVRLSLATARDNLVAQSLYKAQGWVQDDRFLNFNFGLKP